MRSTSLAHEPRPVRGWRPWIVRISRKKADIARYEPIGRPSLSLCEGSSPMFGMEVGVVPEPDDRLNPRGDLLCRRRRRRARRGCSESYGAGRRSRSRSDLIGQAIAAVTDDHVGGGPLQRRGEASEELDPFAVVGPRWRVIGTPRWARRKWGGIGTRTPAGSTPHPSNLAPNEHRRPTSQLHISTRHRNSSRA